MNKVKFGDILLFKSDGSFQDNFIRIVSRNYTHIGIYIGDGWVLEAGVKGVRRLKITDKYEKLVSVYRIKDVDLKALHRMVSLGESHEGDNYSIRDAILAGILRLLQCHQTAYLVDDNWFCSEYVSYCIVDPSGYGDSEFFPRKLPHEVMPDDFISNPRIEYVGKYTELGR